MTVGFEEGPGAFVSFFRESSSFFPGPGSTGKAFLNDGLKGQTEWTSSLMFHQIIEGERTHNRL